MSRSQFHSIKLFILRHAWLNLWDKHMTTGRINQVTFLSDPILHTAATPRDAPHWAGRYETSHNKLEVNRSWKPYLGVNVLDRSQIVITFVMTLWFSRQLSLHLTIAQTDIAIAEAKREFPKANVWCKQSHTLAKLNRVGATKRDGFTNV